MSTYELRTYTLRSAEAAGIYRAIWIKHIDSLKTFGITTHGVFSVMDDPTKVVALVAYPDGAEPAEVGGRYMASDLFKADMAGFDFASLASVETTLLSAAPFSPLR